MADSLDGARRPSIRKEEKRTYNGDENDTPELRAERIAMYSRRAAARCDIFNGNPIGKDIPLDDFDDE